MGGLYDDELFTQDAGHARVYLPVRDSPTLDGTGARWELPAGRFAVALHAGAHRDVDRTYAALGTYAAAPPVDYPLFIRPVAEAVASGAAERGIVLGGSGNGEAIVANRVRGVRCALCWNAESARLGRQHNDANAISLGERMMSLDDALEIVRIWLATPFEGGRHAHRLALIDP